MKISVEQVQKTFNESLRRANCQTWDAMAPFVECRHTVTGEDVDDYGLDLGFNADEEWDAEKARPVLAALGNRITQAVSDYVQWPGKRVVELLQRDDRLREITVPAGCDPGSPDEIRSAFKRSLETLHGRPHRPGSHRAHEAFTLLIPTGAQDSFYDALDGDQPATMLGVQVRLVPCSELLDVAALDKALPAEGLPPQDYLTAVEGVARASPWYVVAHTHKKPFIYRERQRPEIVGPQLRLQARYGLSATEHLPGTVVRVTPSKLTIAQFTPKFEEIAKP